MNLIINVAVISDSDNIREVEPVNVNIRIGNTEMEALVDSGSVCTIINRILANAVVLISQESFWVQSPENHDLKSFSDELIETIVVINTSMKCNDCAAVNFNVTVVEDGHRPIIGRDLVLQLRSNIDQNQCLIKKKIAFIFPGLISWIGKSLKQTVNSTFHKYFTPTHQKGRRVPINLQPLVSTELKKLLGEEHIIKLNSCFDKSFISPIVITVKRDLDSKILNKSMHKNKYQMPNIDHLIATTQHNLNTNASHEAAYFSMLYLKYANSQLKLNPETSRHCNFKIFNGEGTGTYRFITGFYGLTDMPATFQNIIDYTLIGLDNTHCFLDDIIEVSRGIKRWSIKVSL